MHFVSAVRFHMNHCKRSLVWLIFSMLPFLIRALTFFLYCFVYFVVLCFIAATISNSTYLWCASQQLISSLTKCEYFRVNFPVKLTSLLKMSKCLIFSRIVSISHVLYLFLFKQFRKTRRIFCSSRFLTQETILTP